jgi:hypothetical protein
MMNQNNYQSRVENRWKIYDLFVTTALLLMTILLFAAFLLAYANGGKVIMDFNSIGEAKLEFGLLAGLLALGATLVVRKFVVLNR